MNSEQIFELIETLDRIASALENLYSLQERVSRRTQAAQATHDMGADGTVTQPRQKGQKEVFET